MLNYIAVVSIPAMIFIVILIGIKEKIDVYGIFIEGVIDGIKVVYKIFPYIFGITIAVGLLTSTGALNIILKPFQGCLVNLGVPIEILPLIVLRPISGGAAMAMSMNMFEEYGPDSTIGKIVSVIMGGTETTFYTITILFAATKTKSVRGTLIAGLIADAAAIISAIILVNIGII